MESLHQTTPIDDGVINLEMYQMKSDKSAKNMVKAKRDKNTYEDVISE